MPCLSTPLTKSRSCAWGSHHGGSTYNGRLNRAAVRRASQMMDHLLACFLQVLMEHGYVDDWGALCYPPIEER